MEYTAREQEVLSTMQRTDFKNIKKNELLSFASKLGELRPEVAKEVLAQYPEFVGMVKSVLPEYKGIVEAIIASDDTSIQAYYSIAEKELEIAGDSRKQFYDFARQIQADCSKCLEQPDLSDEMRLEILDRELEIAKIASEKDREIREQEMQVEDNANKKDTEKRGFNWKLLGGVSAAIITVVGVSAGVLGGKFDFKLQKNG